MSRGGHSIVTRRSANIEQIPLFYPRGGAAPLQGIPPIATLERFVVYCPSELIISGRAPGRGPEGTGNCSSCSRSHARAVLQCVRMSSLCGAFKFTPGTRAQLSSRGRPCRVAKTPCRLSLPCLAALHSSSSPPPRRPFLPGPSGAGVPRHWSGMRVDGSGSRLTTMRNRD